VWLQAHAAAEPAVLRALALTRAAEQLPRIEHLTLSPDVLTGLLSKLGGGSGGHGGGAGA
ncbi:SPFH domain-containing protein, partial [Streptomyces sp. NPDC047974]